MVNAELNLKRLKSITSKAHASITKKQWMKYCEHVAKVETKYWELDNLVEETIEEISFIVGAGSSDDDSESNFGGNDSESSLSV